MRRRGIGALLLVIAGCGGGGGSDTGGGGGTTGGTPQVPPFGIDTRPSVASFDLPTSAGNPGVIDLVPAFPNLSFSAGIYLSGVPGDTRLLVAQQGGQVRAFVPSVSVATSRLIIDLSGRVQFGGEQGLLGIAFDPNFAANRFIYAHYSRRGDGATIIARYTWDATADAAALASEKIILVVAQPASNHNGGTIAFGPEGYLYIALGDGGGANDQFDNGQNLNSLLGKILRIDVHAAVAAAAYDVPADNPFVGSTNIRPEIWAYGLRNPFRFSFDRQTGQLWVGDVGQNAIEEIDIVTRGANYGWPRFEGTRLFRSATALAGTAPHTPPVFEYDHSLGVAVIGGYVYRGARIAALIGDYIYGDYASGTVWSLAYDGVNPPTNTEIATAQNPTSFGEDNSGEVFVVSQNGGIFQMTESGGGGSAPTRLSQTGLFTDLATLTSASGLIEYDLNLPFWSDGASKRRWVAVPPNATVTFSATGAWTFPVGTVIVKHFEMLMADGDPNSARRLETRVLTREAGGWLGFTYRWNAAESDADLLASRETELLTINTAGGGTRTQLYEYPSRTDCLQCHTAAAGFALGLATRQLNRDFDYGAVTDNQLRTLSHINYFGADITPTSQYGAYPAIDNTNVSTAVRARAYLAVNCAQCHRPGGTTPVNLDLRFDTSDTGMNAIDATPQAGNLGIAGARIIARGSRTNSVLWQRMQRLDDTRMPPLASHRVDQAALAVVGEWIDGL